MKSRLSAVLVFFGLLFLAFIQLPKTTQRLVSQTDPRCPNSFLYEFKDGSVVCVSTRVEEMTPLVITNLRTGEVKKLSSKDAKRSHGDASNDPKWDFFGLGNDTVGVSSSDWRFITIKSDSNLFSSIEVPFATFQFVAVNKDLLQMTTKGSYFEQSDSDPNLPNFSHLYSGLVSGYTSSVLQLDGMNLIVVWNEDRTVFVPVAEFSQGQHLGIYPEWPNGFRLEYRRGDNVTTFSMDQKVPTID